MQQSIQDRTPLKICAADFVLVSLSFQALQQSAAGIPASVPDDVPRAPPDVTWGDDDTLLAPVRRWKPGDSTFVPPSEFPGLSYWVEAQGGAERPTGLARLGAPPGNWPATSLSAKPRREADVHAAAANGLTVKSLSTLCMRSFAGSQMSFPTGSAVRRACRSGSWTQTTAGLAPGYVQANFAALPASVAFDFMVFCHRNPKPCPLLDVTDPGCPEPRFAAPGADLRTDLPKYCILRSGEEPLEAESVVDRWREDTVGFLTGCSFTFEAAMADAGLPLRHQEQGTVVPMYKTNIACHPAGPFSGPMVVSMRPLGRSDVMRAAELTRRFPKAHGGPVHIGDPSSIGITDLDRPDFGCRAEVREGEVPVFWACGVTVQMAIRNAGLDLAITHAPGHMFVADTKDVDMLI
ncbi:unnamed protein product [Ostreobium quekettii]|uniref:Hydro-lyase n=1 Tax=Ostreobium quekettii TaxID=121088 RepID=A0A8S1IS92_9CHLO|nr:unnamed protein product [Ostreobium quekettii]